MNNIEYLIHQVETEVINQKIEPSTLIKFLDLTRLNADDNEQSIQIICEKALTHQVAAVCVYPAFVAQAKKIFHTTPIQVATVANFPSGTAALKLVLQSIEHSLKQGADEVDVVIPYQAYLDMHDVQIIKKFVSACKKLIAQKKLKIILESGAIADHQLLEQAALASLEAGADFLKTSTGKTAQGASLDSAARILSALQRFGDPTRGFKVSGGVHDYQQAKMYYVLSKIMMGDSWPSKRTFRIGASTLLDTLLSINVLL